MQPLSLTSLFLGLGAVLAYAAPALVGDRLSVAATRLFAVVRMGFARFGGAVEFVWSNCRVSVLRPPCL